MPNETDIARLAPARNCQAHVRYTRLTSGRTARLAYKRVFGSKHARHEETSMQLLCKSAARIPHGQLI